MMKRLLITAAILSLVYFLFSILWLVSKDINLLPAFLVSFAFFVVLGLVFYFLVLPRLRRWDEEARAKAEKLLDSSYDDSDQRVSFRREAWIQALKRDQRELHDKIFQLGAVVGVFLVAFAIVMNLAFGLTPPEVFTISWPALAFLWLVQIIFFPRWAVITSLFVFTGLRFGIQTIGPQILMYLPNFLMLPLFYFLMMFFMFGSIMIPNLQQIKYFRPGQGNWEVPAGSTRGQFQARAVVDTQIDRLRRYASGESDRKPVRGMVFRGPPGTGKTLLASEIATELGLPYVQADASAFSAPFMGFGQLIPLIVKHITEGLARIYGGALFFIDEGEILFGARAGMQQQAPYTREIDLWDMIDWQNGCQAFDVPYIRTRQWEEQAMFASGYTAPTNPLPGIHQVFMMPGATGGANAAIYPMLTWMSGSKSAPFMTRFIRGQINTLLNVFLPVTSFGKVLRLSPGKPQEPRTTFITATNRFFMFDPAMIRPKRFDIVVDFVNPDEDERADIAKHYLRLWHKRGYYQDDLLSPERIREFAQATPNASPAEIEQMIEEAVDVRVQHVAELRRVKRLADEARFDNFDNLTSREQEILKRDYKFWLRFKSTVYDAQGNELSDWNDEKVNWQALYETRSAISFGRANPEAVAEPTRRKVSFHEFGHYMMVNATNRDRLKVTLLTVIPRRGSLGMVAHVPHDTREQHPQDYYEGLIRTSIASWVTEHFFFGQNLPGVTGDLRNATNVAVLMIGKFGMSNFRCTPEDAEYYARIGKVLVSEPETSMFNPEANALVERVLSNEDTKKEVKIVLGMAAIDAYRLIRFNQNLFLEVIPEFLKLDEFSGNRLEELWQKLNDELVNLDKLNDEDRRALPEDAFTVINPFYGGLVAEGDPVYRQVEAILEGASQ